MKIFQTLLTILLALLFGFSATTKLMAMDSFDLFFYKTFPIEWNLSTWLTRFLIAVEYFIAFKLIFNRNLKKWLWFATIVLIGFTLWLLNAHFSGAEENCHCFGDFIQMNPMESIIKNILTIGIIAFLLLKKAKSFGWFPQSFGKALNIIVPLVFFSTVVIVSPPDALTENYYTPEGYNTAFNSQVFIESNIPEGHPYFRQEKYILAFMSMGCEMCQRTAEKLSIAETKMGKEIPMYIVFPGGDSSAYKQFVELTGASRFPYAVVDSKVFFNTTKQLPTLFFIDNGKVAEVHAYRTVTDEKIKQFLASE